MWSRGTVSPRNDWRRVLAHRVLPLSAEGWLTGRFCVAMPDFANGIGEEDQYSNRATPKRTDSALQDRAHHRPHRPGLSPGGAGSSKVRSRPRTSRSCCHGLYPAGHSLVMTAFGAPRRCWINFWLQAFGQKRKIRGCERRLRQGGAGCDAITGAVNGCKPVPERTVCLLPGPRQ